LISETPCNIGGCVKTISYEVERLECIGTGGRRRQRGMMRGEKT